MATGTLAAFTCNLEADVHCVALQSHGVLMAVIFVVVLPVSVVIAATFKRPQGSSTWFQVHRALGVSSGCPGPYTCSSPVYPEASLYHACSANSI